MPQYSFSISYLKFVIVIIFIYIYFWHTLQLSIFFSGDQNSYAGSPELWVLAPGGRIQQQQYVFILKGWRGGGSLDEDSSYLSGSAHQPSLHPQIYTR